MNQDYWKRGIDFWTREVERVRITPYTIGKYYNPVTVVGDLVATANALSALDICKESYKGG